MAAVVLGKGRDRRIKAGICGSTLPTSPRWMKELARRHRGDPRFSAAVLGGARTTRIHHAARLLTRQVNEPSTGILRGRLAEALATRTRIPREALAGLREGDFPGLVGGPLRRSSRVQIGTLMERGGAHLSTSRTPPAVGFTTSAISSRAHEGLRRKEWCWGACPTSLA
jgi:hypothetical protein